MPDGKPNGWNEWAKHVLLTLQEQTEDIHSLEREVSNLRVELVRSEGSLKAEISALKVKSGIWGAVGAAIPTVAAVLFIVLKGA